MSKEAEDEIVARLDASERAALRLAAAMLGGTLLLVLLFTAALFSGRGAWLQNQDLQILVAVLAGSGFITAFAYFKRTTPPVDAQAPNIVRKRIDAHHRTWRWMLLSGLVALSGNMIALSSAAEKTSALDWPLRLLFFAVTALLLLMCTAQLAIGPGWHNRETRAILNDEFTAALRARTLRFGFWVVMLALTGLWGLGAFRPDLLLPGLAWALYAGYALPALYYIIADWRAGRGE
ncbi:membrane protein implicated in regulation of membrane protease activity [Rhizomicrobium palustre]|uniref:Membrane protein implicated in regulation of membrane protease activity n=1 Tax=Rhizomicrobium palustre TaxID=189966 RepID=A0A846N319_9PROT|nr:hypothetical protein [Rhizomicrobium palustre]NIK89480.1 membrane protein implicated in regulation of membrane protease activity [Rhizomicrobium palustre]